MTFMEGIKITRKEEIEAAGVKIGDVAMRLVQAFYKMLLVDRFFHADPHPGNFLVEPLAAPVYDGGSAGSAGSAPKPPGAFRLVVLDFGAICEARAQLVDGMIDVVQGYFTQADALVLKGFRRMGFVAEGGNEALLERTVKAYFAKLLKIQDRTPAALMRQRPEQLEKLIDPEVERGELQDLMRSFEYPEDWFYVERACVLMFWLAAQLDPHLDTMAASFPFVMPLIAQRAMGTPARSPTAMGNPPAPLASAGDPPVSPAGAEQPAGDAPH
jgi:predicted unusual protein kinase regulating ubiquinone biosynthesis (AarF/ABC1/UbiB family)